MNKPSFFERLTGSIQADEETYTTELASSHKTPPKPELPASDEDAQLSIDMYQNPAEIIIQAMVAGVRPEDLDVSITQDMVTIKGRRAYQHQVTEDNFYYRELYWGTFTRSILLPQEVDAEESQATIKHGVLNIRLPKLDKARIQKLKVKAGD
ncbi:MAG: Hsp20/alpha crystallin family protein [Patescibacteria group bacterium]